MIYFAILFLLVILTIRYDINGKAEYRDQWYNSVLIILIIIAGLRFRLGEDTVGYLRMFYYETPYLNEMNFDFFLDSDQPPLWILLNSIIKTIGCRFYVVQFVQAIILNVLMFNFFKKHSIYPFACVTLYFFWRYQWYSMVVMKAALALSFILYANDYFLEKKYLKGTLLILIATGFHQSSLVLIITPFFMFLRFNKLGVAILTSAYIAGIFLMNQMGDFLSLFEAVDGMKDKLDGYAESGLMKNDNNLRYFIFCVFPLIVYPLLSLVYLKKINRDMHVLRLEPFIMIALIFIMMHFSIFMLYRFIYIFTPYFIIIIIHFFMEFSKNSFLLKRSVAYVRTLVILIYILAPIAYRWPIIHVDFYPYSSIIERSTSEAREKYYSERVSDYSLNLNEY